MSKENLIDIQPLLTWIERQDDIDAETCLDIAVGNFDYLLDYKEIEEGEWTQDHKYQHCDATYKLFLSDGTERFVNISMARSGSPFTDWYYQINDASEVPKFQGMMTLIVKVKGTDQAQATARIHAYIEDTIKNRFENLDATAEVEVSALKGW